jgi:hypothetical protein
MRVKDVPVSRLRTSFMAEGFSQMRIWCHPLALSPARTDRKGYSQWAKGTAPFATCGCP